MPIHHISDTAHWVAVYREIESARSDALFHDPYAHSLAGERGVALLREIPNGTSIAWAMAVRTAVIDELVLACVEEGAGTVLNLGAGLDARAFRLPLPQHLHWIDVDLPGIVAHRQVCLKRATPACHHRHIAADLGDPAALDKVLAAARRAEGPLLVLSEGLLIYLEAEAVANLARRLHAEAPAHWWLTDLVSPMLLGIVGARWPTAEAAASAPFRFALRDSRGFFEPLGWHEQEFRSILDESIRLRRAPPMAQWWGTFALPWWPGIRESLRRMSGVALMEA